MSMIFVNLIKFSLIIKLSHQPSVAIFNPKAHKDICQPLRPDRNIAHTLLAMIYPNFLYPSFMGLFDNFAA